MYPSLFEGRQLLKISKRLKMYEFISISKMSVFLYSYFALLIMFFTTVWSFIKALDIFKGWK